MGKAWCNKDRDIGGGREREAEIEKRENITSRHCGRERPHKRQPKWGGTQIQRQWRREGEVNIGGGVSGGRQRRKRLVMFMLSVASFVDSQHVPMTTVFFLLRGAQGGEKRECSGGHWTLFGAARCSAIMSVLEQSAARKLWGYPITGLGHVRMVAT